MSDGCILEKDKQAGHVYTAKATVESFAGDVGTPLYEVHMGDALIQIYSCSVCLYIRQLRC